MQFSDKERLDWLELMGEYVCFEGSGAISATFDEEWDHSRVFQTKTLDLREALDAAMLASGLKPQEPPPMEELLTVYETAYNREEKVMRSREAGIRAVVERAGGQIAEDLGRSA